jgi:putative hydrolase of the HAD superfamily
VNVSVILFDLGGVLVDWEGITPLVQLSQGRLTAEQARLYWLYSLSVRQYEIGACTALDFARGALAELALPLTPEAFLEAFRSWDKGALPGAEDLLKELQPRYRLACLSNNNELHWGTPPLQRLLPYFHPCLVSFEIGLMKPDPESFSLAIERIGVPPGQIVFLDDNPECVAAAQACGLLARQARGVQGAREALRQMHILGEE